jgi:ATPase subunit of ABC transporter with duplicated ATPase domains
MLTHGRRREDIDTPDAKPLMVSADGSEFVDVEFGYEHARQIARAATINAHPRRKLAIVGGSGSAKSTLVKRQFVSISRRAARSTSTRSPFDPDILFMQLPAKRRHVVGRDRPCVVAP